MPNSFSVDQISIVRLNEGTDVTSFSCGDGDLEEFLKQDALVYQKDKLAVTYLCLYQNKVVAYVTVTADAIKLDDKEKDDFAQSKARLHEFPGVKIARLAVATDLQRHGLGSILLKATIGKIVDFGKEVGCRFATVDAVTESVKFYEHMGFVRNLHRQEVGRSTVSMRYDLLHYTG